MRNYLHRTAVIAAYQAAIAVGILMLPLAVALQRTTGLRLPLHRVLGPALRAYESIDA